MAFHNQSSNNHLHSPEGQREDSGSGVKERKEAGANSSPAARLLTMKVQAVATQQLTVGKTALS